MERGDLSWAIAVFQEKDVGDSDQVITVETERVDALGILKSCCPVYLGGRQIVSILQCL